MTVKEAQEMFDKMSTFTSKTEWIRKRIKCKSGLEISIQASSYHYSNPRKDNVYSYTSVEVGFPNREQPTLHPYKDIKSMKDSDSVFPYVPITIAMQIIKDNGGAI